MPRASSSAREGMRGGIKVCTRGWNTREWGGIVERIRTSSSDLHLMGVVHSGLGRLLSKCNSLVTSYLSKSVVSNVHFGFPKLGNVI